MKKIIFIVTALSLLGLTDSNTIDPALAKNLQIALDNARVKNKVRSVSVTIIDKTNKKWIAVSNDSKSDPVNANMLFSIASITKTFIAAVTLKLEEEGILSLDNTINDWIASEIASLPNKKNIPGNVTIRQLLNHTSGIRNFIGNTKYIAALKNNTNKKWKPIEVLQYVKKPYFKPGKGCRYSNTNYVLLGMIIEKVTKESIHNVVRKRLLKPLVLENTYMMYEDSIPKNHTFATGYQHNHMLLNNYVNIKTYIGSGISTYTSAWVSGNMVSTSKDIALFIKALLGGTTVLSHNSQKKMTTLVDGYQVKFYKKYPQKRGLGLIQVDLRKDVSKDCIIWGHTGSISGFRGFMFYWPERDLSIGLLVNEKDMFSGGLDTPFNILVDLLKVMSSTGK